MHAGTPLLGALLLVMAVGCASPTPDEPEHSRIWVSVGGDLANFEDDEEHCIDQSTAEADAPLDDRLFAVCMFARGWRENQGVKPTLAVVSPSQKVRSRVNVRAKPSESSNVLSALAAGERAQLLGREGDWYHVRLRNGKEGYVSTRWTRTIN